MKPYGVFLLVASFMLSTLSKTPVLSAAQTVQSSSGKQQVWLAVNIPSVGLPSRREGGGTR